MRAAAQWFGERRGRRIPRAGYRVRRALGELLGRRGAALVLLGTGKIFFGISFIVTPLASAKGLELLTDIRPLHCWAGVWVLCGAVTLTSAFLQIGRDRWGFVAALIPPAIWASAYLYAAATGVYMRGMFIFVWYMTSHVGMIIWASRAPEPVRAQSPTRQGSERGPRT